MRKILLATTAAAALMAGTTLGFAQTSGGGNAGVSTGGANVHGNAGANVHGNTAVQGNTGNRGAAGANVQGGANRTVGQGERGTMSRNADRDDRNMGNRPQQQGRNATDRDRNRGEREGRNMRDRDRYGYGQARTDRDQRNVRDRDRMREGRDVRDRDRSREGNVRQGRDFREGAGVREGRAGGTTRLSGDQRTRIHERLFSGGATAHRLGHVDFALQRGVRVPGAVAFYDLPADIVSLVPAYRDYKYFLVGDEIVIVDPYTHEIVDVIPA